MGVGRILAGAAALLCGGTLLAEQPAVGPALAIPLFSDALSRALDPSSEGPFVATYQFRGKVLTFVATTHVETSDNSTIDAIRRAYVDTHPSLVIVEGFPTAFGQNPAHVLESVRQRGTPNADPYARSEDAFAAAEAVDRKVPFIGGEPTTAEEIDGLVDKGYSRDDVLFSVRLRPLIMARRAGDMPPGDFHAFTTTYARAARAVASMSGTEPISESQFVAEYRRIIGVDPVADVDLPTRADPGTATLLQRLSADNMRGRDEHLLSTILQQLDRNDRVLVVYGRGHWTTLSSALGQRLGKPVLNVLDRAIH